MPKSKRDKKSKHFRYVHFTVRYYLNICSFLDKNRQKGTSIKTEDC